MRPGELNQEMEPRYRFPSLHGRLRRVQLSIMMLADLTKRAEPWRGVSLIGSVHEARNPHWEIVWRILMLSRGVVWNKRGGGAYAVSRTHWLLQFCHFLKSVTWLLIMWCLLPQGWSAIINELSKYNNSLKISWKCWGDCGLSWQKQRLFLHSRRNSGVSRPNEQDDQVDRDGLFFFSFREISSSEASIFHLMGSEKREPSL